MDIEREIKVRDAIKYCIENFDSKTATNRIVEFWKDELELQQKQCNIANVMRSADMWWKKLNHETRVKYATEQLNKRGQVFRYNNDGLISGFTLSDVVELFRNYA